MHTPDWGHSEEKFGAYWVFKPYIYATMWLCSFWQASVTLRAYPTAKWMLNLTRLCANCNIMCQLPLESPTYQQNR